MDGYSALITKDFLKKRKKWTDGSITVDTTTRAVKLTDCDEANGGIGRQVFSGIVDAKLLAKLVGTEEVKLGSWLVSVGEKTSGGGGSDGGEISRIPSPVVHVNSFVPRITIFRPPSSVQQRQSSSNSLNIIPAASSSTPGFSPVGPQTGTEYHPPASVAPARNTPHCSNMEGENSASSRPCDIITGPQQDALLEAFKLTVPSKAKGGGLTSLAAFSCPSSKVSSSNSGSGNSSTSKNSNGYSNSNSSSYNTGSNNSSDNSTISGRRNLTVFTLNKLYYHPHRIFFVDPAFHSPNSYAVQFYLAVREELQLSLASSMSSLENRVLRALNINVEQPITTFGTIGAPEEVFFSSTNGTNNVQNGIQKRGIGNTYSTASKTNPQRRSIDSVTDAIRDAGVPFTTRVEVIVSPPRDEENAFNGGGKWGKGKDNFSDESSVKSSNKRSKNDFSNETEAKPSVTGALSEENTKLYFKVGDGRHRSSARGGETFGKGDIWFLWRAESVVGSTEDIGTYRNQSVMQPSSRNGSDKENNGSDGSFLSLASLQADRASFLDIKIKSGYPLPWFKGAVWQDVWVVRSVWHGISEGGMMEFSNLDNSKSIPMGHKFPSGKKRGPLDGSYSALRMSHEMTSLHTLDLLHGGVVRIPAPFEVNYELQFKSLLHTSVFHTLLKAPSSPSELEGPKSQPASTYTKPVRSLHPELEALRFPTAPRNVRAEVVRVTVEEFNLNTDQAAVLTRVSHWFTPSDEAERDSDVTDGNSDVRCGNSHVRRLSSDVILVHGVFGSGKSHLLASVCVLIKRLSNYCTSALSPGSTPPYATSSSAFSASSASSSSSFDPSRAQQRPSIGVKRCVPRTEALFATQTPCDRVKCLLSANTNVAVDRVMIQLATRIMRNTDVRTEAPESDAEPGGVNSDDFCASTPVIARVGCIAKIDRGLRKHFVLQAQKVAALRELTRLSKIDNDPQLIKLANDTKKSDFSQLQSKLISDADVVGVTCASTVNALLKQCRYHVLILDEASQMTEPLSLLPMACAGPLKLLLVGDPRQLPPALAMSGNTYEGMGLGAALDGGGFGGRDGERAGGPRNTLSISGNACSNCDILTSDNRGGDKVDVKGTLARTLFDRLLSLGWASVALRTQYRCHPAIAQICNELFYGGQLLHGVTPDHRPCLIPRLPPITAVDSKGEDRRNGDSYINQDEATIARDLVIWLRNNARKNSGGGRDISIGVICLYKAQAWLVTRLLSEAGVGVGVRANPPPSAMADVRDCTSDTEYVGELRVSTVDAFQGSEMDIIIICISKTTGSSFLSNAARVNVAVSRARHHLFVLGSGSLLMNTPLWSRVISGASLKLGCLQELKRLIS